MPDLVERFRSIDRIPTPVEWPDVEMVVPRLEPPSQRGRRFTALAVALLIVAAASIVLIRSLGRHPAVVIVSGRATDLPLMCTVRLLDTEVSAGDAVRTTFTFRNVGASTLRLDATPRLVVRDAAGSLLYDTDFGGYDQTGVHVAPSGRPFRGVLTPGTAVVMPSGFRALWGGPLSLLPRCGYGVAGRSGRYVHHGVVSLPSLTLDVTSQGATVTRGSALDRALAVSGGLFNRCRPRDDGRSVRGVIAPPRAVIGSPVPVPPSLDASCTARIRTYGGFAVVDLLFASPSSTAFPAAGSNDYLPLHLGSPPGALEVGRWTFLVTEGAAQQVSPDAASLKNEDLAELQTMLRAPSSCTARGLPFLCGVERYRFDGRRWRLAPTSSSSLAPGAGVSFLEPAPRDSRSGTNGASHDRRSVPVAVLATGDADGHLWRLVAVRTATGPTVGLDGRPSAGAVFTQLVSAGRCVALGPGSISWPSDSGPRVYLHVGYLAGNVRSVSLKLRDGSVVAARIVEIPPSLHAAFASAFLAVARSPIVGLELRDSSGSLVHPANGCISF